MRYVQSTIVLSLCYCLVAGCGAKTQDPNAKVTPAPPRISKAPPVKDVPLDPALAQAARQQITRSLNSNSSSPTPRVHALEAVKDLGEVEHGPEVIAALSAAEPITRFAAALTAGGLKLQAAHEPLLAIANDRDSNVRIAVRYALHRLGDTHLSHDLEKYARDPRKDVRGNTAMVLGMLEEPSALKVLQVLRTDPEPSVRQQAAEAMWRLGDDSGMEALIGMTVSRYPDDQLFALLALAEPRDQRVGRTIEAGLNVDYIEVQLVAARALGMLGTDEGYAVALQGAVSQDPRQRFMAALALGAIGRADTQDVLRKLLADDYESVRIAAAEAILELKG